MRHYHCFPLPDLDVSLYHRFPLPDLDASLYHCFPLPDLDASLHSSYYFGDSRFTSLRRFAPNVLGIAAHLGSLHTGWGRYRDRAPFGGASH
jgi:hypothetical protein